MNSMEEGDGETIGYIGGTKENLYSYQYTPLSSFDKAINAATKPTLLMIMGSIWL